MRAAVSDSAAQEARLALGTLARFLAFFFFLIILFYFVTSFIGFTGESEGRKVARGSGVRWKEEGDAFFLSLGSSTVSWLAAIANVCPPSTPFAWIGLAGLRVDVCCASDPPDCCAGWGL